MLKKVICNLGKNLAVGRVINDRSRNSNHHDVVSFLFVSKITIFNVYKTTVFRYLILTL